MNRVLVAATLGKGREYDHADRAVSGRRFVPSDENSAAVLIRRRVQNLRQVLRKPGVALLDGIVERLALVMHVVAQIRRDEIVLSDVACRQIAGDLREWPDVRDAIRGIGVEIVRYIVEEHERI